MRGCVSLYNSLQLTVLEVIFEVMRLDPIVLTVWSIDGTSILVSIAIIFSKTVAAFLFACVRKCIDKHIPFLLHSIRKGGKLNSL